jgi:hypothetical protein
MNTFLSFIFLISLTAIVSCNTGTTRITSNSTKPGFISGTELNTKQGDFVTFTDATGNYFAGIIFSFYIKNEVTWYGICFTNYYATILPTIKALDSLKLSARKVRYGDLKSYTIGLEVTWARDTLVDKHKKLIPGMADMRGLEMLEIEGETYATSYEEFIRSYDFTKKERLFPGKYYQDAFDTAFYPAIFISFKEAKEAGISNEKLKSKR